MGVLLLLYISCRGPHSQTWGPIGNIHCQHHLPPASFTAPAVSVINHLITHFREILSGRLPFGSHSRPPVSLVTAKQWSVSREGASSRLEVGNMTKRQRELPWTLKDLSNSFSRLSLRSCHGFIKSYLRVNGKEHR